MDKRQKILIVDDSEFNRDMLKEILGETYNYLELIIIWKLKIEIRRFR